METLNTHPFDLSNNSAVHNNKITPPTPQPSQDDLVSGLEVLNNKKALLQKKTNEQQPSNSSGLISPVSPKQLSLDYVTDEDEDEVNVTSEEEYHFTKEESDVATMIYQEFVALIYWNIPGRSGIVLGGILSFLLLTRYYSLLYVCAASLTIATGFNLVFVNFYNTIRSVWSGLPVEHFAHPFHLHLNNHKISSVSRDLVNYYLNKTIDALETVAQATARIIYVEDTKTSGVICLISAFIYYATSFVPTKVFLGLFVLAVFTVPFHYDKHQEVVDAHLNKIMNRSKTVVDKYSSLVRRNSATFYNQSIALVQKKIQSQSKKTAAVNPSATAGN